MKQIRQKAQKETKNKGWLENYPRYVLPKQKIAFVRRMNKEKTESKAFPHINLYN